MTEFILDKETKKIEQILLHQPVKLCEKFIKESKDCYFENNTKLEMIPARFLNNHVIHNKESHSGK
jgi:hypothetical protein